MHHNIKNEKLDFLFEGIMKLENLEEFYNFFEDLCTVSELQEMSRRLQAAKMLNENYVYADIAERTGLSTATISRVNRAFKYGGGGYSCLLDRMKKKK